MASLGEIYTKPIDPSVQDGLDNSLIIQPNCAYKIPLSFGNDYNVIKAGVFFSYTNSLTDNNADFPADSGVFENSGGTYPDGYSYFGVIYGDALPMQETGTNYIGAVWNQFQNAETDLTNNSNLIRNEGSGVRIVGQVGEGNPSNSNFPRDNMHLAFTEVDNTTNFATYMAIYIIVNNRGLSNQSLRLSLYKISSTDTCIANALTDVSIQNLKELMNGKDVQVASYNGTFGFNGDLPDHLFFYNAFQRVRPRIHAIGAKRVS
jgi:hypothetical protein